METKKIYFSGANVARLTLPGTKSAIEDVCAGLHFQPIFPDTEDQSNYRFCHDALQSCQAIIADITPANLHTEIPSSTVFELMAAYGLKKRLILYTSMETLASEIHGRKKNQKKHHPQCSKGWSLYHFDVSIHAIIAQISDAVIYGDLFSALQTAKVIFNRYENKTNP